MLILGIYVHNEWTSSGPAGNRGLESGCEKTNRVGRRKKEEKGDGEKGDEKEGTGRF